MQMALQTVLANAQQNKEQTLPQEVAISSKDSL
jgi:hypothetical protein